MLGIQIDPGPFQYLRLQGSGARHGSVESVGLKPQHDAFAVRLRLRIPDIRVLVRVSVVQLHHHTPVADQLLVF